MNQEELWNALSTYKNLFPDTWRWVVDSTNKCYHIEIKNGSMWIHYPSWASTLDKINDISVLKFPVQVYSDDLPPHHCLIGLYKASDVKNIRIGQWFMDKYTRSDVDPAIYNERDIKVALELIYERWYK
jgi:hypothetical protein